MNELKLYKNALKNLADEGSMEARLILEMGAKFKPEKEIDTKALANDLKIAVNRCSEALRSNNTWCRQTDYFIQDAISWITSAMVKLT